MRWIRFRSFHLCDSLSIFFLSEKFRAPSICRHNSNSPDPLTEKLQAEIQLTMSGYSPLEPKIKLRNQMNSEYSVKCVTPGLTKLP